MNVIKQIRTRLVMSQQQLAGRLGIAQTTLSLYERDEVAIPPDKAKALIALACHHEKPLLIDYNTIYGGAALPGEMAPPERPATRVPAMKAAPAPKPAARRPGRPVVYSGS